MQQLLLAATKSDAEAAYNKENKEPKQSAKPPHKKTKKAETVPNKPLEKEKKSWKGEADIRVLLSKKLQSGFYSFRRFQTAYINLLHGKLSKQLWGLSIFIGSTILLQGDSWKAKFQTNVNLQEQNMISQEHVFACYSYEMYDTPTM